MDLPTLVDSAAVAPDTESIPGYLPLPGFGVLPVNAFLLRADQPVLVDTGISMLEGAFVERLSSLIDLDELCWIWLTHADPDHLGNLAALLELAPRARVVTTYLGMGKMGLSGVRQDRVYLLNAGQSLDVGDRTLTAIQPPTFDAPETTGFVDNRRGILFSADCFGALLAEPASSAQAVRPGDLKEGLVTWATVDAPWLHRLDGEKFASTLRQVQQLGSEWVLSAHLPPASGMLDTLLEYLASAPAAQPFVGPDQRAMESMMSSVGPHSES
jgi:hypothetical protein